MIAQLSLTVNQFTHKSGILVKRLVLFEPERRITKLQSRTQFLELAFEQVFVRFSEVLIKSGVEKDVYAGV